MADEIKNFVFKFKADVSDLKKGTKDADREASSLVTTLNHLVRSNDQLMTQLVRLGTKLNNSSSRLHKVNSTTAHASENAIKLAAAYRKLLEKYSELKRKLNDQIDLSQKADDIGREAIDRNKKEAFSVSMLAKQVLGLAAAYFSVNAIASQLKAVGFDAFDLSKAGALLKETPNTLKAYRNLAQELGISDDSFSNFFKRVSRDLGDIRATGGQSSFLLPLSNMLNKVGFNLFSEGGIENLTESEVFLRIVDALNKLDLTSPENVDLLNFIGGDVVGFDEGLRFASLLGREEIERRIGKQLEKNRNITKQEEDSLREMVRLVALIKQETRGMFLDIQLDNLQRTLDLLEKILEGAEKVRKVGLLKAPFLGYKKLFDYKIKAPVLNLLEDAKQIQAMKRAGFDVSALDNLNAMENSPINNFQPNNFTTQNSGASVIIQNINVTSDTNDGKQLADDLYNGIFANFNSPQTQSYISTNEVLNNARNR